MGILAKKLEFRFRGGNPSLVETLTWQRTQKPGFLLDLVEGVSQETRFIKGFFFRG